MKTPTCVFVLQKCVACDVSSIVQPKIIVGIIAVTQISRELCFTFRTHGGIYRPFRYECSRPHNAGDHGCSPSLDQSKKISK